MNSAGPRGGNLEAQLTPEAAVTAKELAEMLITRRLSAAVFIAAIAGCGGGDNLLSGDLTGPGGAGGTAATAGSSGSLGGSGAAGGAGVGGSAGGAAGANANSGGTAGGASGHAGGAGGTAAGASGGMTGGAGGRGGSAGAGGGRVPADDSCDQALVDYASARDGGVSVTCALNGSGVCECTQVGDPAPNLWCVYLHNEPVPNVLYCTIPGYPLDPCGPDLVAWASKTDGGKTVACTYTSGRCLCGPPGGPPEVQCEVSHAELADVKGSIFCGGI